MDQPRVNSVLLLRARPCSSSTAGLFIVMPGGVSTMENFESATLVQTGKIVFPSKVLWAPSTGRAYRVDPFLDGGRGHDFLLRDVDLLHVVDDPEEAVRLATGA